MGIVPVLAREPCWQSPLRAVLPAAACWGCLLQLLSISHPKLFPKTDAVPPSVLKKGKFGKLISCSNCGLVRDLCESLQGVNLAITSLLTFAALAARSCWGQVIQPASRVSPLQPQMFCSTAWFLDWSAHSQTALPSHTALVNGCSQCLLKDTCLNANESSPHTSLCSRT